MTDIKDFSLEELKEEVSRREWKMPRPAMRACKDFLPLLAACEEYVKYVERDIGRENNNYPYLIFEAAINGIYGKSFWDWLAVRYKHWKKNKSIKEVTAKGTPF